MYVGNKRLQIKMITSSAPVLSQEQYLSYNALQGVGGVVSEAEKGEESKDDNCSCPEGFEFG